MSTEVARWYGAGRIARVGLVVNEEEYRDGNPDRVFKVWPTTVDRDAYRHAMSNELTATGFAASRIVQAHGY